MTTLIFLAGYLLTPETFGPGVIRIDEAERLLDNGGYALSGRGFGEASRPGTGLENMRARARSMHATLEVGNDDGGQVRLVFMPRPAPDAPTAAT